MKLTSFEIIVFIFVAVMVTICIAANIVNKRRGRRERSDTKRVQDKWGSIRMKQNMNSSMSGENNQTYKN